MNNTHSRDSKVLIKEAELLSSSNDFIYRFYKEKSANLEAIFEPEIDQEFEHSLLLRNDRFIDITLAQYCFFDSTISKLFCKAVESEDLALRLACLSNELVGKFIGSNGSIPSALFGESRWSSCPLLLDWFKSISLIEIDVLFKNRSIDDDWLSSMLEGDDDFWSVLSDEKRIHIVRVLSQNPRINTKYENTFIDGSAEYHYNKLFSSIWDLAKKVPVSNRWASALESILNKSVDHRYDFDSIEVAKRWTLTIDDSTDLNDKSYLNSFESVRFHLYKDVIKDLYGKDCSNLDHYNNSDIAYRVCAYSKLKNITADDMNLAVEKDGTLAVHYLLMNEGLWRLEESREFLKDLCFKVDEKSRGSDLDCVNGFEGREEMMKKLHPSWFVEKIFDESSDDDKPLNLGMMREFVKELKEDLVNSILLWSNSYGKRIMKIEWIFYGVIATVILVLMK